MKQLRLIAQVPLPPEKLAYAAGVFDGEGWPGISGNKGRYALQVRMGMTDRRVPDLFRDLFGGSINPQDNGEGHKPVYIWIACGTQGALFLRAVRPFLVSKAEAADICLEFADTLMGRQRAGGRKGWTADQGCQAEELRARLRQLHHPNRGVKRIPTGPRPIPDGQLVLTGSG